MKLLITILMIAALVLPVPAQNNASRAILPLNAACTQFTTAATCASNISSKFLNKGSAWSALADSKTVTCSFWICITNDASSQPRVFSLENLTTTRFAIDFESAAQRRVTFVGNNSGGTQILSVTSALRVNTQVWSHVYITFNLSNSSLRKLYINGTNDASASWTTYTDDSIDLVTASPNAELFSNAANNRNCLGALAEFWFDDVYLDSISAFYCTGRPSDVGSTGSTPNGTPPALYLSRNGSGNSWATDSSGNGNTFSVNGTMGSLTSP